MSNRKVLPGIAMGITALGALVAVCIPAFSSNGDPFAKHNAIETPHAVQAVTRTSAHMMADMTNCTRFKDLGPAVIAKVLDSGTCWIGTKKYAIDTFSSQEDRDLWVANMAGYGVNVKWETSTAVVYPSISNSDY